MVQSIMLIVWPLVLYFSFNLPCAMACLRKKKVLGEVPGEKYCRTETCGREAQQILDALGHDVQPCDDFYKFACGDFLRNTRIPDGKVQVDRLSVIENEVLVELSEVLGQSIPVDDRKHFKIAKQLYKACTSAAINEQQGLRPLVDMLKWLGGWPVVEGDNWNEANFNYLETVYKLHDAGHPNFLLELLVEPDLQNNTKHVLTLQPSDIFYIKPENYKSLYLYWNYIVDLAVMLGADRDQALTEIQDAIEFKKALQASVMSKEMRSNVTAIYNPMTVAAMTQKYPSIPWKEYFQRMLPKGVVVNDDEVIVVRDPAFIAKLEELISQMSKRVQANYMMYRVVLDSVNFLNSQVARRHAKYMEDALGYVVSMEDRLACVQSVYNLMPMSVSALYVRKHPNENTRQSINEMVDDMKRKFLEILQNVDWMDNSTRKRAVDKLEAMTSLVGYRDVLFNDYKLAKIYEDCVITETDSYYYQYLNVTRCTRDIMFNALRTPGNESYAAMFKNFADVNAYHIHSENKIVLPMALLQGIIFNIDRPKYLNYANIGYIIAREMHHHFDSEGRQYDKNGNLFDWWSAATEEKYLAKAQCVREQYGNYTVPEVGLKVNGANTEVENFADIGGLKLAYLTYLDWVKRNGPEPRLPNLPYSPNQLFWISLANSWCTVNNLEFLKNDIAGNRHSPAEFRILGSFSNTPEFADDFNCRADSKMNSRKKCTIW